MAAKPDWYYRRSGCNTCKKMDAFLESRGLEAKEVVSAQKARLGPDDALEISRKVQRIVAARGKSVVEIDMKKGEGDEATLLKHLVGPTGGLRAPVVRTGKTLLVGFNEEAFDEVFS